IQVQIIRPRQYRHEQPVNTHDLHTTLLPGMPLPGYKELKFGVPLIGRISSALKDFAPNVIYVATEGPMGWAAVRAAHKTG
ncbi:hypothetical protein Q4595_29505, partial [Wenyingzhuangia sp. 1_MG-2023]|nr:hypothetical protein [Wenyingzhuangia sp. 1_MG-2023]